MLLAINHFWLTFVIIVLLHQYSVYVCKSHLMIKDDIMIESTVESVQKPHNVHSKRAAVIEKIWDFGVIPYEIDTTAGFDDNKIANIKAAMRHWENFTCIIFIERNSIEHEDFIRFTQNDSICNCCSHVGKQGGVQDLIIGNYCSKFKSRIAHELGHAIGYHHEHNRPDRDEYIEIKKENYFNDLVFKQNFEKLSPREVSTLDEPYDFDSIMHYSQVAGSKYWFLESFIRTVGHVSYQGKNLTSADIFTILPKKGKNGFFPKLGRNIRLSTIDIRKTKKLYNCPECGRTYFDQAAAFTSPEYYSKSLSRTYRLCEWRITVKDGQRIRLKINDLSIFKSDDCKSDYLEVRDGYWYKSPLLGRFCGTNISEHIMVSTGNRMIINYVSSYTKHRGFAANYEAISASQLDDCGKMNHF